VTGPAPATPPGRIVPDGEWATLEFERLFPQPPGAVWKALTDPEALRHWYMTEARIEARPGGSVELVAGPSRLQVTGRILTWDPPRVLEHEWKVAARPELPSGEDGVIRWELRPDGTGTRLRLTHARLRARTAGGFAPGTHAFLDRLAAQLDGRSLPNWQERYTEVAPLYPSNWTTRTTPGGPPTG